MAIATNLGFPRIGPKRELKKAVEGFWAGRAREGEMLETARRKADARIRWTQGDAVQLPFLAASFDHVLCQQGLQFFPRAAALAEIRRVLVPGGRVGVLVWSRIEENPYSLALARAVGRHIDDEVEIGRAHV